MSRTTPRRALVIGNSAGVGRAFTDLLLAEGWQVAGLSRSTLDRPGDYAHVVCNVTEPRYPQVLGELDRDRGPFDLVTHCVGVGTGPDEDGLASEPATFETNLMSLVRAVAVLGPGMIERRAGHLIGLSSIADDGHLADAPSYSASKAGYSSYLRGLALYLRTRGVAVTNVRFGFVDTKMAKSDVTPMMISPGHAARLLLRCVRKRPVQLTYPKTAGAAMRLVRWWQNLRAWTR